MKAVPLSAHRLWCVSVSPVTSSPLTAGWPTALQLCCYSLGLWLSHKSALSLLLAAPLYLGLPARSALRSSSQQPQMLNLRERGPCPGHASGRCCLWHVGSGGSCPEDRQHADLSCKEGKQTEVTVQKMWCFLLFLMYYFYTTFV